MKTTYSNADAFIAQLKNIEELIIQNQLQDAAKKLNVLGKTDSHDPRLFILGSRLAQASGNAAGMLQAARKAHELAPEWPIATIRLAKVLEEQQQVPEAIKMADAAIEQATQQSTLDVGLLSHASAIAQRQGYISLALKWLDTAEKLQPEDLIIRLQTARAFDVADKHEQAIARFTSLMEHLPGNADLLSSRMHSYLKSNQMDMAIVDGEELVKLQPDDERHRFFLSYARGENPKNQPAGVISTLFDGYADRFDKHLVVQLQYRLPQDVANMIHSWHPDRKGDVLDLGCGTGLLGACLGPIQGVLVGVDLSIEMIDKAIAHKVYDKFHHVDVSAALKATPADQYHVIAALEVFVYIGNLDEIVPNAFRILVPGGRFIFSCELAEEGENDFNLQQTFRYTHQTKYLKRLMEETGFEELVLDERSVRMHAGEPVSGLLVIGRKPAAS